MNDDSTPRSEPSPIFFQWSGSVGSPKVVLIHGSLDRMAGMARVSREIDSYAHVLRYDRRGYGKSWPHSGPFTVADQVADLVDLLDGQRAVLVGHSYGGNVALACAATHPELVIAVSTYETPLSWLPWWPGSTAGAASMDGALTDAAERFMRRLIGDDRWEELPDKTKEQRRREGVALVGELRALRQEAPWNPDAIGCPVVCGHGEFARDHHKLSASWMSEQINGARKVVLPGAAHDAPTRHAESFSRELILEHVTGV